MIRMPPGVGMFLILSVMALPAQAVSLQYTAPAIEGQVVAAVTKKPLAGVIVAANWELLDANNLPMGQLTVMETITDQEGRFSFPAWGPKAPPITTTVDPKAPQILFLKSGFQHRRLVNAVPSDTSVLSSEWNGKTIELTRFPVEAVAKTSSGRVVSKHSLSLSELGMALGWVYGGKDCEWKKVPRMLVAVHRIKLEFDRQGLHSTLRTIDDLPHSDKCGSPKEFFGSYLP